MHGEESDAGSNTFMMENSFSTKPFTRNPEMGNPKYFVVDKNLSVVLENFWQKNFWKMLGFYYLRFHNLPIH